MTVARYNLPSPVSISVMSPHQMRLRTLRATRPSSAMSLAMVLTDTRQPCRISVIQIFGEPYVPPDWVNTSFTASANCCRRTSRPVGPAAAVLVRRAICCSLAGGSRRRARPDR